MAASEWGPGLSARTPGRVGSHLFEVAAAACLSPFHLLRSFPACVRSNAAPVPESLPIGAGEISSGKNSESR